jgi:hypothetical protein
MSAMGIEQRAQVRADAIERATAEATNLIQTHFADPEAWVRLAFSVGTGEDQVFHFDAFGPTLVAKPQVLVSCSHDHWLAELDD